MIQIEPRRDDTLPTLYVRLGGHPGLAALLKTFYTDVQQHEIIGPIFNEKIQDRPAHLANIAEFWALQTGGPTLYGGGFAGAHLGLGRKPDHFQHWLSLWEYNSRRRLHPREAEEMIALAHEFGRRLQRVLQMQGRPG